MPYRTQDNVIDGVVITFTDASAARALETALRDQASQLRQLAESLPNLVWGCRPDGVCDYLSRQWVEYTGVPEEEQIGWRWLEQVHSDDRERVRDAWRASVKSGAPFDTELRLRAAGGGYRWFKSRSVAIRDNKGHIAKWHGTLTDVDDLKQARDGAGDTVRRLAMVVDTMREGYVELDAGLAVRSFNQPAIRMLGHGPEDVRGKRLAELLPEIRGTAFERQIQHAVRADAPTPFEAELPAANGRPAVRVRFHPHLPPESFALFLEPAGR
jgi:PAS domain S-box-containing protein